jgi:hypothetical protein
VKQAGNNPRLSSQRHRCNFCFDQGKEGQLGEKVPESCVFKGLSPAAVLLGFFVVLLLGASPLCAASAPAAAGIQVSPGVTVCLLEPKVSYQRVEGAELDESAKAEEEVFRLFPIVPGFKSTERPADSKTIANDLRRAAAAAIQAAGATPISTGDLAERHPDKTNVLAKLGTDTENLLRGLKPASTLENLRSFAEGTTNMAVLVLRCTVRVGPVGGRKNNNQMTYKMHSTTFQGAILQAPDGQSLWRNSSLLRELPNAARNTYQESIARLFQQPNPTKKP